MIKVGQVYINKNRDVFVVTRLSVPERVSYVIYPNGYSDFYFFNRGLKEELISEYPTWQEAINSPEFKGEELTFEQLAEFCEQDTFIRNSKTGFALETVSGDFLVFWKDGNIEFRERTVFNKLTPEQMKQIIIAGGLKNE